MTTALFVETSVTVNNNNSPIQGYAHPNYHTHREYFMESAGVRYLRTSCWRIRNRMSERS